jgi:hypothetical protein
MVLVSGSIQADHFFVINNLGAMHFAGWYAKSISGSQ